MDTLRECAAAGLPLNLTYRCLREDGSLYWLHLTGNKIREENGVPVYYCIFTVPTDETALYRDIAEDSAAERAGRRHRVHGLSRL